MAQELLTLLEHLSSQPVFSGVRVIRSLVLCVDRLSFCTFCHCVVCPLVSSSSSSYYLKDFYDQIIKTLLRRPFDNVNNNYHCWKKEYAFDYLVFQYFDLVRTWWRLFQKCVICTKFDTFLLHLSFLQNIHIKKCYWELWT